MTEFASGRRTLVEQRVFAAWLAEKFDAVEVTGLEGWERIRKVYGGTIGGECPSRRAQTPTASPSASSLVAQEPLFPDLEDAA